MDVSKQTDIATSSSTEFAILLTHMDNLSKLVQDFISMVVVQSAGVHLVRPRQVDVCLSPGSNSSGPLTVWDKPAAVELSHFNGQSVEAWLFLAECYFEFYSILSIHQISLVSFYLEGQALDWYHWMFRNKQLLDWPHFVEKLCLWFQEMSSRSSEGRHSKLIQILWSFELDSRLFLMKQYTCLMSFWLSVLFRASDWIFRMKSLLESPHP